MNEPDIESVGFELTSGRTMKFKAVEQVDTNEGPKYARELPDMWLTGRLTHFSTEDDIEIKKRDREWEETEKLHALCIVSAAHIVRIFEFHA